MSSLRTLFCVVSLGFSVLGAVEPREKIALSKWEFAPEATLRTVPGAGDWTPVTVPHIFRQSGLADDTAGWYRQEIVLGEADRRRRIFLHLEGASTVKTVIVNGVEIGQHRSAFTGAVFDLTPALVFNKPNRLDLRVSNRSEEVQGLIGYSYLYYTNGGMFRKAWLIKTGEVHIDPYLGSSGVFLTPGKIDAPVADLKTVTHLANPLAMPVTVQVRQRVTDPAGVEVAQVSLDWPIPAQERVEAVSHAAIPHPVLWDLGKPNLYTVTTEVVRDGVVSDVVIERTGLRTITWADGRFRLNGREVQFRGVNKHAQDEYSWNAISDAGLRQEWDWMRTMGVNAVRLAHYAHASFEYELADEQGLAVWAENGFAGHDWEKAKNRTEDTVPEGIRLTRELVRQRWNHPSILFWSCGNETDGAIASTFAKAIRDEQDPNRLLTFAQDSQKPDNVDFVARNTYDGWYGDTNYNAFAEKPINALISETGAGTWLSQHVPYGTATWKVNDFEPEEYGEIFTEYRLQTVCRNDVAARPMFLWWTFREFYNDKFRKNRNTKGLVTLAGEPKDLYYLFQAFFAPQTPVLRLTGRNHLVRSFAPDNGLKAYANAPEVELILNGVSQGWQRNGAYVIPEVGQNTNRSFRKGWVPKTAEELAKKVPGIPVDNVFFWKVPLKPGRNVVEVADRAGHRDRMVVYQTDPAGAAPADPTALVQDLRSGNPASPALFIDRPIAPQAPFYRAVDGSSDNTFDLLPAAIAGASWIATPRLSDPAKATDLSFTIRPGGPGAVVTVMLSTGTFPTVTLRPRDSNIAAAAGALTAELAKAGFIDLTSPAVWRGHDLERADAALWQKTVAPGETVTIPRQVLDYVVLIKSR